MPSGRRKNIQVGWPWEIWRNLHTWRRTKPGMDCTIPAAAADDDDDDYDDDVCLAARSSLAMNSVKSWSHAPCVSTDISSILFWTWHVFIPSRWFNVCCSSEQTVSGLLRDWPRRPYHSVLSNILLCFHCLLCSCRMLSGDHPQVVIADQPERNQHVAPQLSGYVPGIPATKCCGTSIEDTFRSLGEF